MSTGPWRRFLVGSLIAGASGVLGVWLGTRFESSAPTALVLLGPFFAGLVAGRGERHALRIGFLSALLGWLVPLAITSVLPVMETNELGQEPTTERTSFAVVALVLAGAGIGALGGLVTNVGQSAHPRRNENML